jgi:hypothetical protein
VPGINEFSAENMILLHPPLVAEPANTDQPRSKPVRNPKPFTVFQTIPGQSFPKLLFVKHAYSLEQARALVAAKVAGESAPSR